MSRADLPGDDLVERRPGDEVLGLGPLGRASGQPRASADGVSALERTIDVRDDDDLVAEGFDRLEDRAELEVDAGRRRCPVTRPLAHRHEHRAEPLRRRGRGFDRRGHRGNHRLEQRQESVAPRPRRTVRRDSDVFVMNMTGLSYAALPEPLHFRPRATSSASGTARFWTISKDNRGEAVLIALPSRARPCGQLACQSAVKPRPNRVQSSAFRSLSARKSRAPAAGPREARRPH